tara:strand:+ start:264 stop:947 length:684 start_codon:yes stop_codon:yes gene_type:complete
MNKITVVIPTLNEFESLDVLLKEIHDIKFKEVIEEIIVVDANSTDGTLDVAKKYKCKIINQNNKVGYGSAIVEGIKNTKSYFAVILDGDGSKNPSYIIDLYNAIQKNNCDFIFASRYGKDCGSLDDTLLTFIGNRIFTLLGKIFFNVKINDILHTFFICKTESFNAINFKYTDFSFCVELPILVSKLKISHDQISSHERKRISGKVKVNSFVDGYKILKSMIKIFFS